MGLDAPPVEVVAPPTGEGTKRLNGTWKFRYSPGPVVADDSFTKSDFDDTPWSGITVPSNWELEGFAEPKYGTTAEGFGDYRTRFTVPAAWQGERVFLRFDGALYGLEAFINGRPIGSWASSYNQVTFDVTAALRSGENILAVRVSTRVKGWDFDLNDCWGLSGIFRDVTLFSAPPIHLKDFKVQTSLTDNGAAVIAVQVQANGAGQLSGQLRSPDGRVAGEIVFPGATNSENASGSQLLLPEPKLWTAETPALYTLELVFQALGQRPQVVSTKVGIREVRIVGGVLELNRRPIKLRGVDHHDIWPDTGRATNEEKIRRDLIMIMEANCNFVRTSHYPPHPKMLELCDELGLYVMDEVPFGFGDANLTNPAYQEVLNTRARATLLRDKNHPSVIIWSVGNENPNTPLTFATGKLVKALDPTRPICFPQVGPNFDASYHEIPDWVDIYAPHYPNVANLERYARELSRPVIITEYAHGLGIQVDRIQDEWAIMQASPRLAGGAVWMFQDQGILRTAAVPVDPEKRTPYVWRDATHYYDTNNHDGMDGIVYSDRTPQPDYWMVRKAYAPVQIVEREIILPQGGPVKLQVENRYDFISLSGYTLAWAFERNGKVILKGELPLQAVARTTESVTLPAIPLADSSGDIEVISLQVRDPAGRSLNEHSVRILRSDANASSGRLAQLSEGLPKAPLRLESVGSQQRIIHERFSVSVDEVTGLITITAHNGQVLLEGIFAHTGRRFTEAELMRVKQKNLPMWSGSALLPDKPAIKVTSSDQGITISVSGRYTDPSASGRAVEGGCSLLVTTSGTIEVGYNFVPVAESSGILLEAGASLVLPVDFTEFRWLGDGPFAGYPGADNLNEYGLYHLTRDDIRFQGNRRNVEAALLTNTDGTGLLLVTDKPADIAVERTASGLTVSQNALLSGRGNKQFAPPETIFLVEQTKQISGHFTLVLLEGTWTPGLQKLFGSPQAPQPTPEKPFYHSYDQ